MNKNKLALVMPDDVRQKLKSLSKKEKSYFKKMWPKSGVLYITSKPGIAKSAILRDIAAKMDYAYYDLRLSMRDETDLGLFPDKIEIDGKKYLDFLTPRWAIEANLRKTIIHFEELNRSKKEVRDAVLQMLLERGIGFDFKFNSNVLMVASGNLGEEDGTDIEEFDGALNNRLIHMQHYLEPEEWLDGFARENIHYSIVQFIERVPTMMYNDPVDKDGNRAKAYASPRTWEFLSDYIISNYGIDASVEEFIEDIEENGACYVGSTILRYIEFIKKLVRFSIKDVINNFDGIKDELLKANRDRLSDLVNNLKNVNLETLSDNQRENIHKFLAILGEDELADYVLGSVLDRPDRAVGPKTKEFFKNYPEILLKSYDLNIKNKEKTEVRNKKK